MENLLFSANVVLPLFILMAVGCAARKIGLLDEYTSKKVNELVFKLLLPALIINNVYRSDISEVFDKKLVLFAVLTILIAFAVLMAAVPIFEKNNSRRGVLVQAMFRSNFVIFGIPVCTAICGSDGIGKVAILIAIVVPVYNFLAVIALESFRSASNEPFAAKFIKIVKGILKNPLIISSAIGLALLFSGLRLPSPLEKALDDISGIATPLALIILGASMNFSTITSNRIALICGLAGKLLLLPAIALGTAFALGFRNAELAILMSVFATPTAVSSFPMAQQMDGDSELACQLVVIGTCVCIFTIFAWVYVLRSCGGI